jgi:hypothetical protein
MDGQIRADRESRECAGSYMAGLGEAFESIKRQERLLDATMRDLKAAGAWTPAAAEELVAAQDELCDALLDVALRAAGAKARSIAEVRIKARVLSAVCSPEEGDAVTDLMLSLCRDLERLPGLSE